MSPVDDAASAAPNPLVDSPLVADRPLPLRLALIGYGAIVGLVGLLLVGLGSRLPDGGRVALGVALLVILGTLGLQLLRAWRRGSFRFAADARAVHFRPVSGESVRSLPWGLCLGVHLEERDGATTIRFRFERSGDDFDWRPLRNARVFLDERTVDIVSLAPPAPDALLPHLERLRAGASVDTGDSRARRAA